MLDQGILELLEQTYLHLRSDLSLFVELVGATEHWLRERGHPIAAYSHASSLENCVNQTLDCVFKHDIANIADLRVALCPHARIQDKTMTAEFFHLTLEASNLSQACSWLCDHHQLIDLCTFLNHTHSPYLFLLARIHPQHKLLNIVPLRIIKHELQAGQSLGNSRCF